MPAPEPGPRPGKLAYEPGEFPRLCLVAWLLQHVSNHHGFDCLTRQSKVVSLDPQACPTQDVLFSRQPRTPTPQAYPINNILGWVGDPERRIFSPTKRCSRNER
eukprot:364077-Chlamydomonas_euryale.AAC.5